MAPKRKDKDAAAPPAATDALHKLWSAFARETETVANQPSKKACLEPSQRKYLTNAQFCKVNLCGVEPQEYIYGFDSDAEAREFVDAAARKSEEFLRIHDDRPLEGLVKSLLKEFGIEIDRDDHTNKSGRQLFGDRVAGDISSYNMSILRYGYNVPESIWSTQPGNKAQDLVKSIMQECGDSHQGHNNPLTVNRVLYKFDPAYYNKIHRTDPFERVTNSILRAMKK